MLLLVMATAIAVDTESSFGITISPEPFEPRVFLDPNTRIVYDDYTEPGAITDGGEEMIEREHNYAFEGEQIIWEVLVWDKNSDDKIEDVYVAVQNTTETGDFIDFIEADCYRTSRFGLGITTVNTTTETPALWYEGEEEIVWNDETMDWYQCELTVETPASMNNEHWVTIVAEDLDGGFGYVTEEEYWFLNPTVALGITGSIAFGEVRPGATVKSSALLVGNAAQTGSGVMLDMFVAGTDFFDPSNSGTMCPTSNVLLLGQFSYYATSGAYNTCLHPGDAGAVGPADAECYVGIPYYMTGAGGAANNNMMRVIDGTTPLLFAEYPPGNVLSPGAEMTVTFKLALPEPCNGGSFSDGSLTFRGEAR